MVPLLTVSACINILCGKHNDDMGMETNPIINIFFRMTLPYQVNQIEPVILIQLHGV